MFKKRLKRTAFVFLCLNIYVGVFTQSPCFDRLHEIIKSTGEIALKQSQGPLSRPLPRLKDPLPFVKKYLDNYSYSKHAKRRLRKRKITTEEINFVLRSGSYEQGQDRFSSIFKRWSYSIVGSSHKNRKIRVIVEFAKDKMIIITAMNIKVPVTLRRPKWEKYKRGLRIPKIQEPLLHARDFFMLGQYEYSNHAVKRLTERNISNRDVEHIILYGRYQPQNDYFNNDKLSWNYVIAGKSRNEKRHLKVVVALDSQVMTIITAMPTHMHLE